LLRLHLHPCHSIHNKHTAIEHAHAALHLSNSCHARTSAAKRGVPFTSIVKSMCPGVSTKLM
jgi:hypothetical protein